MTTPLVTTTAPSLPSELIAAARAALARGWAITPLRGKRALLPGWTQRRLTESELPRAFHNLPATGVGLLLGHPSGNVVDLDVDDALAEALAPTFLPPTPCRFGRDGRARHWLYRLPEGETVRHEAWRTPGDAPDGATLVELRGDGCQSALPPSRLDDGDAVVRWCAEGEPAPATLAALQEAVGQLAAAALLARHWRQGQRESLALAVAGGLLRADWSAEQVARFITAVAQAAEDEEAAKRVEAVVATARKQADGAPTTGWPTLATVIGPESVARLRQWLRLREAAAPTATGAEGGTPTKPPSQASQLVMLAHARYTLARTGNGAPIAVPTAGPPLALPLRAAPHDPHSLRGALASAYQQTTGRTPTASALADALQVLTGEAATAPVITPALRVATWQDGVALDLGRSDGQCVVIRPGRWDVAATPPGIVWKRTALSGELPVPVPGGDLRGLRDLVNLTDDGWQLFQGAVVASLLPDIPHCLEYFRGPAGSGKSTAARLRVQLVDPSPVPLRQPPTTLDDWAVAASGSWLVFLDNLSDVKAWFADALCRAVTGDGLVKRTLYSDDSPFVVSFRRVVGMTSISLAGLPGDLADRIIGFELERIPDDRRREEAELWTLFQHHHPVWLGALLDLVAQVLAVLPTVRPARLPRMADYARVLAAVDAVAGTQAFALFCEQQGELAADVIEADSVAQALHAFALERGTWSGTARDLWDALLPEKPPRSWPADAARLGQRLRVVAEPLRRLGVTVSISSSRRRGRRITITTHHDQGGKIPSPPSPPSPGAGFTRATAGEAGTVTGQAGTVTPGTGDITVPAQGPQPRVDDPPGDGGDGGDGKFPPFSVDALTADAPEQCPGCGADAADDWLSWGSGTGLPCCRFCGKAVPR